MKKIVVIVLCVFAFAAAIVAGVLLINRHNERLEEARARYDDITILSIYLEIGTCGYEINEVDFVKERAGEYMLGVHTAEVPRVLLDLLLDGTGGHPEAAAFYGFKTPVVLPDISPREIFDFLETHCDICLGYNEHPWILSLYTNLQVLPEEQLVRKIGAITDRYGRTFTGLYDGEEQVLPWPIPEGENW